MVSLPATVGYAKRDRDASDAWETMPEDFGDPTEQAEHELEAVCVSVSKTRKIKFGTPANFDFNPAGQSTLLGSPVSANDIITCTRASGGYMFDAQGNLQYFEADTPMIGYDIEGNFLGLLASHGEVVNRVVNPRAEGAVVGGGPPTGWNLTVAAGGLTRQIVAVGEDEFGIPRIRIRFFGTTSGGTARINTGLITVTDGAQFNHSMAVRHIAGDLTPISGVVMLIANQSPFSSSEYSFNKATIQAGWQRISRTRTSGAGSTTIENRFGLKFSSGEAVDVTFDIALSQMTQTPIAYPPILPPAGTIAQSTLAPVYNRTDCSGFWSDTEGTVVVDWNGLLSSTANNARVFQAQANDQVAATNESSILILLHDKSTGLTRIAIDTTSTSFTHADLGNSVSGDNKLCVRYKASASRGSLNGATGANNTSTHVPASVGTLAYGNNPKQERRWERLYMKRFQHFPSDFNNAELKRLAT